MKLILAISAFITTGFFLNVGSCAVCRAQSAPEKILFVSFMAQRRHNDYRRINLFSGNGSTAETTSAKPTR